MEQVQTEGNRQVKRTVEVYNLDMIISVGYRVNSQKATNFRKYKLLHGKGSISRDEAESKAKGEYDLYKGSQQYLSDFDKSIKELKRGY